MKWWPVGLAGFPITRWWLATSPVSQAGDGKALLAGCRLTPQGLETMRRTTSAVERKAVNQAGIQQPSDL